MTYEEITTAAKAHMESRLLTGMSELYKAGMSEGFIDGARWAQKQMNEQGLEQLEKTEASLKTLLKQVETLQADIEKLKSPKE